MYAKFIAVPENPQPLHRRQCPGGTRFGRIQHARPGILRLVLSLKAEDIAQFVPGIVRQSAPVEDSLGAPQRQELLLDHFARGEKVVGGARAPARQPDANGVAFGGGVVGHPVLHARSREMLSERARAA